MLVPASGRGDDTDRLQRALDQANAHSWNGTGIPAIKLHGTYTISDTIRWGRVSIDGGWPHVGTTFRWNGPNDRPAFSRPVDAMSYGFLHGVKFMPGAGEPSYWLDLTARYVDALFSINGVQFAGGLHGAVKMIGWVNLHWNNLRFDNVGGYAIDARPPVDQNLSTFVVNQFTYDHNRADRAGLGLMRIDNSALASNVGTVVWRDGRIEVNAPWSTPAAIFTTKFGQTAQSRSVGWQLDGVTYQDVVGQASDVLLYRDTTHAASSDSLVITNSRLQGLSAFAGGAWADHIEFPRLGTNVGTLVFNTP